MTKKMTIEDLAVLMNKKTSALSKQTDDLAVLINKKTDELSKQTDDLAIIVKNEFEDQEKKFDKKLDKKLKNLVTKDYLDEKLSDLRGDLVVLTRKEDTKLKKLISILSNKNIISKAETDDLFNMEPFPELSLHTKK